MTALQSPSFVSDVETRTTYGPARAQSRCFVTMGEVERLLLLKLLGAHLHEASTRKYWGQDDLLAAQLFTAIPYRGKAYVYPSIA